MTRLSITRRRIMQLAAGASLSSALGGNPLQAASSEAILKPIPASGEKIPAIGIGTNRYKVGTPGENAVLQATIEAFGQGARGFAGAGQRERTSPVRPPGVPGAVPSDF